MPSLRYLIVFATALIVPISVQAQDEAAPAPAPGQAQASVASAQPTPEQVRQLSEQAAASLVIIKYVWEGEADRRELEGLGLVVSAEGLVIAPLDLVPIVLPDEQVGQFQILVPRPDGDPREIKATLQGRDERSNLLFVKADAPAEGEEAVTWTPLRWRYERPPVGEWLVSVGRLPESSGWMPYVFTSRVAAHLRGPVPIIVADGGVASTGGVVLGTDGQALGLVERIGRRSPFLTQANGLELLEDRPNVFIPADYHRLSLESPPTAGAPLKLPYLGVERLTGLTKELREYYELGDRAAVQVGDVVPDTAAAEAAIKPGDVIVALNGQPLERGDTAEEQPDIFLRTMARLPVGEQITLTLLDAAKASRDVTATLRERPTQMREAERWYAEDLGFAVRELVFADRYVRRLPLDTPGVAVAFVREQGNAAAAGLRNQDLIRKLNQNDVQGLADFTEAYKKFREASPNDPVVLEVLRGSETQVLRIEAPR